MAWFIASLRERIQGAAAESSLIPVWRKKILTRNGHASTAIEGNPLTPVEVRAREEGLEHEAAGRRALREVSNFLAGAPLHVNEIVLPPGAACCRQGYRFTYASACRVRNSLGYNLDSNAINAARRTSMIPAKQEALESIRKLPDDADMEEIMYRLYVIDKIRKGQDAVNQGQLTTSEELMCEIEKW